MPIYIMLNKPSGCVTACRDDTHSTVMDCLNGLPKEVIETLHPVGRLDIDTEGLLLLTDDGKLDYSILQPGHHVEKRYFFRAFGDITDEDARRLENGIELYHKNYNAMPAKYEPAGKCTVRDVFSLLPAKRRAKWMKNPEGPVSCGYLTVTEGKKHQIKLMIKSVGCHVFTLKRVSLGGLSLDEGLAPGEWRYLTDDDLSLLGYTPPVKA